MFHTGPRGDDRGPMLDPVAWWNSLNAKNPIGVGSGLLVSGSDVSTS